MIDHTTRPDAPHSSPEEPSRGGGGGGKGGGMRSGVGVVIVVAHHLEHGDSVCDGYQLVHCNGVALVQLAVLVTHSVADVIAFPNWHAKAIELERQQL
jgi:hypothetical protein